MCMRTLPTQYTGIIVMFGFRELVIPKRKLKIYEKLKPFNTVYYDYYNNT